MPTAPKLPATQSPAPFDDSDFLRQLREEFANSSLIELDEWEEHLLKFESGKGAPASEALRELRRLVHSMKGSSQAVGFVHLGAFVHEFEEWLDRSEKTRSSREIASIGLAIVDELKSSCRALGEGESDEERVRRLRAKLN